MTGSSIYWKSGISGSFQTAADWSTGTVPGPFDQVFIQAPGHYIVAAGSDTIASLSTSTGATLDVSGTGAFFFIDMQGSVSGPVTSTNQGTLEATNGEIAIALSPVSGPVSFTNTGTIETVGSNGFISIADFNTSTPFVNNGQLIVDGGTIAISDSVEGTGRTTIENGGTLLIGSGQFNQVIHFAPGANGNIDIAFPPPDGPTGANPDGNPSIKGIVSGFGAGDTIDVGAALFGAGTILSYAPNSVDNGGTLTITNGDHSVALTLAGTYQPLGFHFANGEITYTLPPTKAEFFNAAEAVYQDNSPGVKSGPPPFTGLTVIATSPVSELSDGFFGQAFQDNAGNVIIAFEGSILSPRDPSYDTVYGAGSRQADIGIFLGSKPSAFSDAYAFATQVEQIVGSAPIFLTGHSLGGAEAESVALNTGLPGVTFGAPGILPLSIAAQNFTNYVDYGDPIGKFKGHFGSVDYVGSKNDSSGITDALIEQLASLGRDPAATSIAGVYHSLQNYGHDLGLHLIADSGYVYATNVSDLAINNEAADNTTQAALLVQFIASSFPAPTGGHVTTAPSTVSVEPPILLSPHHGG
ncbi:MAG: hypothetical protein ABR881_32315 [Candidatus Sulfotelmatobacter sp.]